MLKVTVTYIRGTHNKIFLSIHPSKYMYKLLKKKLCCVNETKRDMIWGDGKKRQKDDLFIQIHGFIVTLSKNNQQTIKKN